MSNYPFLTSKERDNETGLDYFGARYYANLQGRFTSVDPSSKSINASNPQTWNRYTYASNNPLAYVDKNGKWPTPIHNEIIDRAFRGLSRAQRESIKAGSWYVDDPTIGGQFTSHSNEHGQTIPGQSKEDAATNAATFIQDNVDLAKATKESNLKQSLFNFGMAFHTVSDMTSPAHEGYSVWKVKGLGIHMDTEKLISSFRMGLAVGATLRLYEYTYGKAQTDAARGYTLLSGHDPTVEAIHRDFMLSSNPNGEAEALYEYRLGLREGLNFDWCGQNGRREMRVGR